MNEPFAPFVPSMPPLMTAEKARNIGRSLYGLAQSYADANMPEQATAIFRQSEWWLAYARTTMHLPHSDWPEDKP